MIPTFRKIESFIYHIYLFSNLITTNSGVFDVIKKFKACHQVFNFTIVIILGIITIEGMKIIVFQRISKYLMAEQQLVFI